MLHSVDDAKFTPAAYVPPGESMRSCVIIAELGPSSVRVDHPESLLEIDRPEKFLQTPMAKSPALNAAVNAWVLVAPADAVVA